MGREGIFFLTWNLELIKLITMSSSDIHPAPPVRAGARQIPRRLQRLRFKFPVMLHCLRRSHSLTVKIRIVTACILLASSGHAQPYRILSPEVIDLGRVMEGQSIEGKVLFLNTGGEPLRIASANSSCGCTAVLPGKTLIAPNDTAVVRFVLRTTGMHGLVRKAIDVQFEDPGVETIVFTLQARVYSEIELKPSFLVFQGVRVKPGSAYADTLQITNASGHVLRILKVDSDSDLITAESQPVSIPQGSEARVRVVLKPKKAEYRNAILTIETDNPNKPKILVPILIDAVE
jgi:hypothetical protein